MAATWSWSWTIAGTVTERVLWGPAVDQVLAEENSSGVVTWALTDNQNTVRDLAVFNGSVTSIVDHFVYTAFGQPLSTLPADFQFGYTGSYFDTATGLQWNLNRWYNPNMQRWLSQDPLGLGPDSNPYRYCGNGPTDGTDPSGMEEKPVTEWLEKDVLPKIKLYPGWDRKEVEKLLTAVYQPGCIGVAKVLLGQTSLTMGPSEKSAFRTLAEAQVAQRDKQKTLDPNDLNMFGLPRQARIYLVQFSLDILVKDPNGPIVNGKNHYSRKFVSGNCVKPRGKYKRMLIYSLEPYAAAMAGHRHLNSGNYNYSILDDATGTWYTANHHAGANVTGPMLVETLKTEERVAKAAAQTSGVEIIGNNSRKLSDNEIWYTQAFYCLGLEQVWAHRDPKTGIITPVPLPKVAPSSP